MDILIAVLNYNLNAAMSLMHRPWDSRKGSREVNSTALKAVSATIYLLPGGEMCVVFVSFSIDAK